MSSPDNIILCGFMGTGKTTVGQQIAAQLGWRFVDTDKLIEERCGKTVREIFAEDGEASFRQMERNLCGDITGWYKTVIATGGGIVLNPNNRYDLESAGLVVCLDAPAQEIVNRLAGNTDRPLLAGDDPAGKVQELLTQRREAYAALSNHVDTTGKTPAEIANQIIGLWQKRFANPEAEPDSEPKSNWLKTLFSLNLPVDNPIYKYDIRDIRWLKGATSPQRWGWTRLLIVYTVTILLCLLVLGGADSSSSLRYGLFGVISFFTAVGGFFASVYGLIADVRYVMLTTGAIGSEIVTGQWDILRLTNLDERDILNAKHSSAIVRSWRIMTIERALITASAVAQLIFVFATTNTFFGTTDYLYGFSSFQVVAYTVGLLFGFILPYWRMRAVTALGLGISTVVQSTTYAVLAGFAVAFGLRLIQFFIGIMISIGLTFGIIGTANRFSASSSSSSSFIIYSLIAGLLPSTISLIIYVVTEMAARRYTARTAFYSDRQP